jgi:hypothetical protein
MLLLQVDRSSSRSLLWLPASMDRFSRTADAALGEQRGY